MFNEREIDHEKVWRIISHAPQECVGVIVLVEAIIPRAIIPWNYYGNVLFHFDGIITRIHYHTEMYYYSFLHKVWDGLFK